MTIKYLDSKRISGLSTDTADAVWGTDADQAIEDGTTYTNQGDADASWIKEDSNNDLRMNFSNKSITANGVVTNLGAGTCTYDLGVGNVSDTHWVIDFSIDITAWTIYSSGASAPSVQYIFSSQSSTGSGDHLGLRINSYTDTIQICSSSDNTVNSAETTLSFTEVPSDLKKYYVRMIRDGTSLTVELYSDSDRKSLDETRTMTLVGDITGQRYFGVFQPNSSGSGDGVINSTVDNIRFYNGVTTPSSKPTDVQDNSIFVETDTARRYWADTNAKDSTKDGTNTSATTGVTGKVGNAWDFNGSASKVDIGSSSTYGGLDKFSTSFWLNPDTNDSSWSVPLMIGNAENPRVAMAIDYYNSNGLAYFYVSNSNEKESIPASNIPKGSWTHFVAVYDGTQSNSDRIKIYIDGSQVSSTTSGTIPTTTSTSLGGNAYLGYYAPASYYYDGLLDEMLIYNTALTSTEVSALYNSDSGTSTPDTNGLITHYNFEQTGNTLENQVLLPTTWTMEPTFRDDFSLDNFTDSNARFGVSGGVLAFDNDSTTTDYATYLDLGVGNVSDSAWVMRFKLVFTTLTSSSNLFTHFGLSSNTSDADTVQDYLGLISIYEGTGSSARFMAEEADGAAPNGTGTSGQNNGVAVQTRYIQLTRLSTTSYEVKVFSDSAFTTLVETISNTIPDTIVGLRYIKLMNRLAAGSGSMIGYIDDLEFYNGVTSIT